MCAELLPCPQKNPQNWKRPLENTWIYVKILAIFTADKLSLQKVFFFFFFLTANRTESLLEICRIKYSSLHWTDLLCVFYLFKYLTPWQRCIDQICRFCIVTNTMKQIRYWPWCDWYAYINIFVLYRGIIKWHVPAISHISYEKPWTQVFSGVLYRV